MPVLPANAAWRSPELGECVALQTTAGALDVFQRGHGRAIVFAHGWLANANLWRKVVARLAPRFRCVTLDLPLGSHLRGAAAEADLSPEGLGRLIGEALAGLDLADAVLVGDDWGGAYSQIAAAQDAGRLAALVLNACETPYDPFPPTAFAGLQAAARTPGALRGLIGGLRDPAARMAPQAYGGLAKRPIEEAASDTYILPILTDDRVLADAEKAFAAAAQEPVAAAGERLKREFARPVKFIWPAEDQFFPLANARRFAGELMQGSVTLVDDARSFTPEDNPAALAEAIAELAAAPRAPR